MNAPLLVVGADGLLGRALTLHISGQGEPVTPTALLKTDLPNAIHFDLTANTWPTLPPSRTAIICAAVTSQDQCRKDPVGARNINVVLTLKLARQLIAADTFVVFISTNLVFDGSKPIRQPDEPRCPRTEYGRHKAEVEQALAQWPDNAAIVRLTKVFHSGLPLLKKWREELSLGRPVNAFSDYVCSPIHLATVIAGIARVAGERRPGIWQFSGLEDVSYSTLAQWVAKRCGASQSLIHSAPAPAGAVEELPRHTTLDVARARQELRLEFPGPEQVLADCLAPMR